MKEKLSKNKNIKKLVIPKIGCGLDRLSWDKVEPMVQEIFKDLDTRPLYWMGLLHQMV